VSEVDKAIQYTFDEPQSRQFSPNQRSSSAGIRRSMDDPRMMWSNLDWRVAIPPSLVPHLSMTVLTPITAAFQTVSGLRVE
jgi:hypothetical protein